MKSLLALFALVLLTLKLSGQEEEVPRFERISIAGCGCTVYMPEGSPAFEMLYSPDSALVFTSEYVTSGGYGFAAIAVRFKETVGDNKTDNEALLIAYLDYLQTEYGITSVAGVGRGHTLESNPDAVGVIDYWEDADGYQYAVKGWVDPYKLAILIVYGQAEYPHYNAQEMFLNGFRFE